MNTNTCAICLLGTLMMSCAATREPAPADDQAPSGMKGSSLNVNAHLGYRRTVGSAWRNFEDQGVGGISVDYTPRRFPIGFEAAAFRSIVRHEDKGEEVDRGSGDLSLGLHKEIRFGSSPFHMYVGAGVAVVKGEMERKGQSGYREIDDDSQELCP